MRKKNNFFRLHDLSVRELSQHGEYDGDSSFHSSQPIHDSFHAANQRFTQATSEKKHLAALLSQYSHYTNQKADNGIFTNTVAGSSPVNSVLNVPCQLCQKLERDLSELQAEYERNKLPKY